MLVYMKIAYFDNIPPKAIGVVTIALCLDPLPNFVTHMCATCPFSPRCPTPLSPTPIPTLRCGIPPKARLLKNSVSGVAAGWLKKGRLETFFSFLQQFFFFFQKLTIFSYQ